MADEKSGEKRDPIGEHLTRTDRTDSEIVRVGDMRALTPAIAELARAEAREVVAELLGDGGAGAGAGSRSSSTRQPSAPPSTRRR